MVMPSRQILYVRTSQQELRLIDSAIEQLKKRLKTALFKGGYSSAALALEKIRNHVAENNITYQEHSELFGEKPFWKFTEDACECALYLNWKSLGLLKAPAFRDKFVIIKKREPTGLLKKIPDLPKSNFPGGDHRRDYEALERELSPYI